LSNPTTEAPGADAGQLAHGEVEERLDVEGRELLRQMFQDHLDLRAQREPRREAVVVGADGVARRSVAAGHEHGLLTVFGKVEVSRLAYRRRGHANLHPADSDLNLPVELYSHGLRRLAVVEATRRSGGAPDSAWASVRRHWPSGPRLGARTSCPPGSRKGEKRKRKRMAEVGSVYDIRPVPRTPDDVLAGAHDGEQVARPAPRARNKWLMASVVEDAGAVVSRVFDEAERRDSDHRCFYD
jgi:hypothetical protein